MPCIRVCVVGEGKLELKENAISLIVNSTATRGKGISLQAVTNPRSMTNIEPLLADMLLRSCIL